MKNPDRSGPIAQHQQTDICSKDYRVLNLFSVCYSVCLGSSIIVSVIFDLFACGFGVKFVCSDD